MLSSSSYVLLKLYETTSPQKQFPSDCITRYKLNPPPRKEEEEYLHTFYMCVYIRKIKIKILLFFRDPSFYLMKSRVLPDIM